MYVCMYVCIYIYIIYIYICIYIYVCVCVCVTVTLCILGFCEIPETFREFVITFSLRDFINSLKTQATPCNH